VKDGNAQKFFVRAANATAELSGQAMIDYSKQSPAQRFQMMHNRQKPDSAGVSPLIPDLRSYYC